ncbi:MAG TPA: SCO1664 family protein [Dehalococcoidia bacterium]|nr:SCO1664 family protein [Dehalococcoidia bacterium]
MSLDKSACDIIQQGEIISCNLTPLGSNYTFTVQVQLGDQTSLGIYKPRDGESPLWDFPSGTLYKREYAAYLLSQHLGWDFIPYTTIRDGPYGIGTLQLFVDHDPKENYYTLTEASADQLKTIACFDLVANSTDRKPNHLLLDEAGKLWSIDHGLTFHSDTKIRTVIWDFCGERIPKHLLKRLSALYTEFEAPEGLLREIQETIHPDEMDALRRRVRWVLSEGVYPGLPGRNRRGR